jgi:hypothetical protein
VIAVLYVAREILIPLAFAITLALIMAPAVAWLQKMFLGRVSAVAVVMTVTIGITGAIGWMLFNGVRWVPFEGVIDSGPSATRPTSPTDYQEFYDTDILARIWWERGAWRTVDGVPGDIKFVITPTAAAALTKNPGWALAAQTYQQFAGVSFVSASKDPGAAPVTSISPLAGITEQPQGGVVGTGPQQLQINNLSTLDYTPTLALWALVKT